MTLHRFLDADSVIQWHALAGVTAICIGPFALRGPARPTHKIAGYVFVLAMFALAVTSFFIEGFEVVGPFSPLHGFAILTLWSLTQGMRHIFAGQIAAHRAVFESLYWNGLLVAGLFNFLPGRTVNRMLFGDQWQQGWWVIALGALVLVWRQVRLRRKLAVLMAPSEDKSVLAGRSAIR